MNEIGAKLKILYKALDRKEKILEQIINITDNQEMFFKTLKGRELNEYMNLSVDEKQKLIDELNDIDTAFIGTFQSFKGVLNENKELYKEEIISMQDKIRNLVVLDMQVRAKEERMKVFLESIMLGNANSQNVTAPKIKGLKASKNYILEQYKKNKKGE